jgi:phosphomannomutase
VLDIGLCGTEGSYFATSEWQLDGGIMVTASHNPPDYNGMKFVREGARPISADTGLLDIRAAIASGNLPPPAAKPGVERTLDIRERYVRHLLQYVDPSRLRPLKVVVNAGNGGAGLIVDLLEPHLPFQFIKLHHEPDGTFPHGVPNPMLDENRYWITAQMWAWRGTGTTTAVFSLTRRAPSSRATTWWACWLRCS